MKKEVFCPTCQCLIKRDGVEVPCKCTKTEGAKHDQTKPKWDLLPWRQVGKVVDVLTFGADKYAPRNWELVQSPKERYFAAAMRHLVAWKEGERRDPESKLSHLAHAACCLLFLMWFDDNA